MREGETLHKRDGTGAEGRDTESGWAQREGKEYRKVMGPEKREEIQKGDWTRE